MSKARRKVRVGRVVGTKMARTIVVAVEWSQRHPIYKKAVRRITRFYADDKESQCKLGDLVKIEETRPISKLKRWRVIEVMAHREIASEIQPAEIDRALVENRQGVVETPGAEGSETGRAAVQEPTAGAGVAR